MATRPVILLSFLALLSLEARAQPCGVMAQPQRVSGAPGELVTVTLTPNCPDPQAVSVAISIDPKTRGVRTLPRPLVSRRQGGGFEPVQLRMQIEGGTAAGESPVALVLQPLAEKQRPGGPGGTPVANAFVLEVKAGAPASFDFIVGPADKGALIRGKAAISVAAPGRTAVRLGVKGDKGFAGPVKVTFAPSDPATTVESASCQPAGAPQCRLQGITISLNDKGIGSEDVMVTASAASRSGTVTFTAAGAGAEKKEMLQVSVTGTPGPAMPPVIPGGPLADSGAPVPPLPPEIGSAARAVEADNREVEGLAEAITKVGMVIEGPQGAEQVAFLKAYDALIAELSNPMAFAEATGDPDIDPEVLMALIEESGVLARDRALKHAVYQVASLTGPQLLFQMDYPLIADRSGIPIPQNAESLDFATARTKVDLLVMQIFLSRLTEGVQMKLTGPARDAVDKLNEQIEKLEEKLGGDKTAGRAERALKHLMVATIAVTAADVMAKAAMAYLPNEITAFYAEINGQRRNEGDPPVNLMVGQKVPIKVWIETKSPGGQIATPFEFAGWVLDAVTGTKSFEKFLDRMLGTAGKKEEIQKKVREDFMKKLEQIWTRATGLPPIKQWMTSMEKKWDVKPFYNKPIEVNSNKVLKLESRSPRVIQFGETKAVENKYHLEALAPGQEAGYHIALKADLIAALNTATAPGVQLGRLAVVNVGQPPPQGFCAGMPNANPNAGKACRYADGHYMPSKDGILIAPPGAERSQYPGTVSCEGVCMLPF